MTGQFSPANNLPVPFDRSYWVVPGFLLAGCYPGDSDALESTRRLSALIASGIRIVVNLTERDEVGLWHRDSEDYVEALRELAKHEGVAVEVQRWPIPDLETPSSSSMSLILDAIDRAVEGAMPVYVHCWGGVGRTGTVVGCYLARHGLASGEDILAAIARLRGRDPDSDRRSPETFEQRRMVTRWKAGE